MDGRRSGFGEALREARQRRGLSQLELALQAKSTARHLSFLETGRSRPGEDMVLRLCRCLDLPLRQRNRLLRAAGFPPAFTERALDDAALRPVTAVIDRLLAAHEPFPAYVVDARWRFRRGNRGGAWLWRALGVDAGDVNMLSALFEGDAWEMLLNREALLAQAAEVLDRDAAALGDPVLSAEAAALRRRVTRPTTAEPGPVVSARLRIGGEIVEVLTTVCRLGNANDVTVDELRVELVFPADAASEQVLRALGATGS